MFHHACVLVYWDYWCVGVVQRSKLVFQSSSPFSIVGVTINDGGMW